jgi:foldase protein PrsA
MPRKPPIRHIRGFVVALTTLLLAMMLVACGGGAKDSTGSVSDQTASASSLPRAPGGVLARVGPISITQATFDRWFAADVSTELPEFRTIPVPPDFTACIDHLLQTLKHSGQKVPVPSRATVKGKCADQYQQSKARVLNELITSEWVVGAAEELRLKLSESIVELKLMEDNHKQFPSEAAAQAFLRESGQTKGDVLFRTRVELLEEAIRARLNEKVGPFTPARIAAYYNAHRADFAEPEARDLHIVRVETLGAALKARSEIASGASFAKVVASVHVPQPIYSKNGLIHGLKPHVYSQPPLNNAIFSAKPGVLSHPVHITLGYYVFEVTKIHPPRSKPLAAVSAKIKSEVPKKLQEHALAAFIARWRKHWSPQTVCAPGFIVRRCKQYELTPSTPKDDAYTFN